MRAPGSSIPQSEPMVSQSKDLGWYPERHWKSFCVTKRLLGPIDQLGEESRGRCFLTGLVLGDLSPVESDELWRGIC